MTGEAATCYPHIVMITINETIIKSNHLVVVCINIVMITIKREGMVR